MRMAAKSMKNMALHVKWACTLAAVLLAVTLSGCGTPQQKAFLVHIKETTPQERADIQTRIMTRELDLSSMQQKQIQQINLDTARQIQHVVQTAPTRRMLPKKIKPLFEAKQKRLKRVLDGPQYQHYSTLRKQLRDEYAQTPILF